MQLILNEIYAINNRGRKTFDAIQFSKTLRKSRKRKSKTQTYVSEALTWNMRIFALRIFSETILCLFSFSFFLSYLSSFSFLSRGAFHIGLFVDDKKGFIRKYYFAIFIFDECLSFNLFSISYEKQ